MAVYDYTCRNGHQQEQHHRMDESPSLRCTICNEPVARRITGGSFVLKGTGWYSTDARIVKRASDVHGSGIT